MSMDKENIGRRDFKKFVKSVLSSDLSDMALLRVGGGLAYKIGLRIDVIELLDQ